MNLILKEGVYFMKFKNFFALFTAIVIMSVMIVFPNAQTAEPVTIMDLATDKYYTDTAGFNYGPTSGGVRFVSPMTTDLSTSFGAGFVLDQLSSIVVEDAPYVAVRIKSSMSLYGITQLTTSTDSSRWVTWRPDANTAHNIGNTPNQWTTYVMDLTSCMYIDSQSSDSLGGTYGLFYFYFYSDANCTNLTMSPSDYIAIESFAAFSDIEAAKNYAGLRNTGNQSATQSFINSDLPDKGKYTVTSSDTGVKLTAGETVNSANDSKIGWMCSFVALRIIKSGNKS